MIRVDKPTIAPTVLSTRGVAAAKGHCGDYDSSPAVYRSGAKKFKFARAIYAAEEVRDALLLAQHKKCAFCESFVRHVSYGDVEHFRPKMGYRQRNSDSLRRPGYYWLAYEWGNLFFCCQLCNQQFKRNLFPLKDGRSRARSHSHQLDKEEPLLVDPAKTDPAGFLTFHQARAVAVGACREGQVTIRVLGLNRSELMEARGRRLQILRDLLLVRDLLREKSATNPTHEHTERLRSVERTLQESRDATSEYAAMARAFLDTAT